MSLVSRGDKHLSVKLFSTERRHRDDTAVLLHDAVLSVQPLITPDLQSVFLYVILEYLLGYVRFEYPHGARIAIYSRRTLAGITVFGLLLPAPRRTILIVQIYSMVKIPC